MLLKALTPVYITKDCMGYYFEQSDNKCVAGSSEID
jgi:hypothetical protein